jgi:type IV secretion system protein VirB9
MSARHCRSVRRPLADCLRGCGRRAHRWVVLICICIAAAARAELLPARGPGDGRIREAAWREDEVFRLQGRVGYQIDLQFEPGETFVGLAAGDLEALSFVAEANHLFLKPRARAVHTNLTVLTSRRQYQFEYTATSESRSVDAANAMYVLRFSYPVRQDSTDAVRAAAQIEARLRTTPVKGSPNLDYWYCGAGALRPVAASDDGLHTRLRFAERGELPAIFVRNDDGSESLINFSIDAGEVVVHRLAAQLVLRRGQLKGCIVNKAFRGGSERASSGTVTPDVARATRGPGA